MYFIYNLEHNITKQCKFNKVSKPTSRSYISHIVFTELWNSGTLCIIMGVNMLILDIQKENFQKTSKTKQCKQTTNVCSCKTKIIIKIWIHETPQRHPKNIEKSCCKEASIKTWKMGANITITKCVLIHFGFH